MAEHSCSTVSNVKRLLFSIDPPYSLATRNLATQHQKRIGRNSLCALIDVRVVKLIEKVSIPSVDFNQVEANLHSVLCRCDKLLLYASNAFLGQGFGDFIGRRFNACPGMWIAGYRWSQVKVFSLSAQ